MPLYIKHMDIRICVYEHTLLQMMVQRIQFIGYILLKYHQHFPCTLNRVGRPTRLLNSPGYTIHI